MDSQDGGNRISWYFPIHEPGMYYIIITDAVGRWARTDTVSMRREEFYLYAQTETAVIDPSENRGVRITVQVSGGDIAKKDGSDDVTFDWYRTRRGSSKTVLIDVENDPYVVKDSLRHSSFWENDVRGIQESIVVTLPGDYYCVVTDRSGNQVTAWNIEVRARGYAPFIYRQPEDVIIPGSSAKYPEAKLVCWALYSGETGSESSQSNIVYNWWKYTDEG